MTTPAFDVALFGEAMLLLVAMVDSLSYASRRWMTR